MLLCQGCCPETWLLSGRQVPLFLNQIDFWESPETGLQLVSDGATTLTILRERGDGRFRLSQADSSELDGYVLDRAAPGSPRPPFGTGTYFNDAAALRAYLQAEVAPRAEARTTIAGLEKLKIAPNGKARLLALVRELQARFEVELAAFVPAMLTEGFNFKRPAHSSTRNLFALDHVREKDGEWVGDLALSPFKGERVRETKVEAHGYPVYAAVPLTHVADQLATAIEDLVVKFAGE